MKTKAVLINRIKQSARKAIVILTVLFFSNCKTLHTTAPIRQADNQIVPQTEISSIQLPIQVPIAPLNAFINKAVPTELYYGKDIPYNESITATVRVLRNGPISIEVSNGIIRTTFPIKVVDSYILYDYQTIIFGRKKGAQPFSAAATVTALTSLGVDRQWNITSKTISSFTWTEEPSLDIAGFKISLGKLADSKLNSEIKEYLPLVDQYIKQSFNLRATADTLWQQLAEPIKIIDTPAQLWLNIRAREFNISPLTGTSDAISLNVGMKAFLETTVGQQPVFQKNTSPLLPLITQQNYTDHFSIFLPIELNYNSIRDVAKQQLIGQTFPVNETTDVIINDLDFYGSAGRLVVMADIFSPQKRIKGKVYLIGSPEFNPLDSTLHIKNIDFDLDSRNVLLKSANWLLHGMLQRKLEQYSCIKLGTQLSDAQKQLETSINQYQPTDQVTLKSSITNLDIKNFILRDSSMRVCVSVRGKLAAKIIMNKP